MSHYPYRDAINDMMEKGWNVRDDLKEHSLEELREVQNVDTIPFAVCVVNVLGDLNVGMILRSACCFGAEKFFIIGRRKFDRRSAVGAQNYMDIVRVNAIDDLKIDSRKVIDTITEHGYTPLVYETGGRDFREMKHVWPKLNKADAKPCLIFGNECPVCPSCDNKKVKKIMSACTFYSKGNHGQTVKAAASASSCGGCSATSCSGCSH